MPVFRVANVGPYGGYLINGKQKTEKKKKKASNLTDIHALTRPEAYHMGQLTIPVFLFFAYFSVDTVHQQQKTISSFVKALFRLPMINDYFLENKSSTIPKHHRNS